ncbi:DUF1349 domain-containing protein [Chitinophaga nivalis]|uniref:DUF1349 domain-containing protein n=1 Tax=Chitinophaga nivalis TaxID=2991709 RepID=A0ABT3IHT3_9BACT|nr:DUF1349 domain-containing protein [Chitinophaga nivalis]MCW3466795.1 DUF1349 domain-containing protein [Chitinophaga nivalis]MCW3483514.1 DUF1349 domain-containing protein [Chitinophaga nivalis]
MKKHLYLLSILLLAALHSIAAAPPDSITIPAIPHACSWINQPASFKITGANALSITAAKGSDYYNYAGGGYNIATAPILAFTPDENFVLTTRIKVDFHTQYDGGALYLFVDSLQWTKFLFEKSHAGKLIICAGVTNIFTDESNNGEAPTNEVYFRLGKSGKLCGLFYSLDGKKWEMIRMFHCEPKGQLRIGFSSQSPQGTSCTSYFSDIKYTPKAFKDFWTGE